MIVHFHLLMCECEVTSWLIGPELRFVNLWNDDDDDDDDDNINNNNNNNSNNSIVIMIINYIAIVHT